ncbi:MAG: hypothetical protein IK116_04930, partial [Firmicutes bacterium]|nr:hypothetical protein [Bacillota bacterium]
MAEFGGHGIRRIDLNMSDDRDVIWQQILENYGQVILEQPVIQAEEMARFHPQSVNTVRVVAMNKRDGSKEIIQTSVRLGTGESVVDNGCLSASVDTETG